MPGMQTKSVKTAAKQLVDSLPDDVTWGDVMYRVHVRQAIDAGRRRVTIGRCGRSSTAVWTVRMKVRWTNTAIEHLAVLPAVDRKPRSRGQIWFTRFAEFQSHFVGVLAPVDLADPTSGSPRMHKCLSSSRRPSTKVPCKSTVQGWFIETNFRTLQRKSGRPKAAVHSPAGSGLTC
jgi:hypothetical protein